MSTEFQRWFEAQWGKRPSRLSDERLVRAERDTKIAANRARSDYKACMDWDHRRGVAFLAWQAARHPSGEFADAHAGTFPTIGEPGRTDPASPGLPQPEDQPEPKEGQ